MQVELYILQSDSGKTWGLSAHIIVLFNSMLIFVDWTLSERLALGWDKATMGVVSKKSKIWLILSQGQFFFFFHYKALIGGQHCPTRLYHWDWAGYHFVSMKKSSRAVEKITGKLPQFWE